MKQSSERGSLEKSKPAAPVAAVCRFRESPSRDKGESNRVGARTYGPLRGCSLLHAETWLEKRNMLTLLLFIAGLAGLVLGASALVRGASGLALRLGLSPLVVGLTVVAFGTSAPEFAVSAGAVASGQVGLAFGNVVGSNIFNVLLVLGLSALITPLAVHRQIIRQEVPVMIGAALLITGLGWDGSYGLVDGALLVLLLIGYTAFLVVKSRAENGATDANFPNADAGETVAWDGRLPIQLALIGVGLVLLVAGSQAIVAASVQFARTMGVSEVVIGLTIVAAGTSLPEVAASIMASIKGERDMAVGNVIGSCVFNLLGVLGVSALVAPLFGHPTLVLPPEVARFDLWVMLAAFLACLPVLLTNREIARWEGGLFLAYYVAYTGYLVLAAQRHVGTEAFADAMLGFFIPLSVVTAIVLWSRRRAA